jgi:isopentenyl-diphosphate delta-isomerase
LTNNVILVDEKDTPLGTMEKLQAHKEGVLHRAFSVFLFNKDGDLLLQRRNEDKYHSGGLWTNTCCSHPKPGESMIEGASTRLQEEMGISTTIEFAFSFIYKAIFENGLIENEYDHVFIGSYNAEPNPAPEEVSDWRYVSLADVKKEISETPENYTAWFKIALPKLEHYLKEKEILL